MKSWRIAHRSEWKRDGICKEGTHSCLDTGHGDECCHDDSYCFVDPEGLSSCCPLGSNCIGNSVCNSKFYYCASTTTTVSPSVTAAPNDTSPGCCSRRCAPSYYLCPSALGGNCCQYGWECLAGGKCAGPLTTTTATTTTTTTTATATSSSSTAPTPSTSQCSGGVACTSTATPSAGGLSAGAKTGIAITAVAGAGVLAGVISWLWVLRRRHKRRAVDSVHRVSEVPGDSVPVAGYTDEAAAPTAAGEEAGAKRVVPLQPNTPADIASPVELDSAARADGDAPEASGGAPTQLEHAEVYEMDATDGVAGYRNIATEDSGDEESTF